MPHLPNNPSPRFDPGLITDTIDTHHATIFLGVLSLYVVLLWYDMMAESPRPALRTESSA
ncbi:hypothetical protein Thiowin_00054 [Thiorhodovibrio winogradskyi]|uniref:Uncharacterized protein n=1 Tax=Thiorhodovibrio winogradskyi TaxID=77007 RepID=A0ABZ0S3N6_9GAMM|nr:hypothetical protein [Thiorhodovibrio winogradskyi]